MKPGRILAFTHRVWLELCRDPLSYLFAVGFPLVMLVVMTFLNDSIPAEANMTVFRMENLAPGISVFGLTFFMPLMSALASKDRSDGFLVRLSVSPMPAAEVMLGYALPVLGLAVLQGIGICGAAWVLAAARGEAFALGPALVSVFAALPAALLMIGLGLLFGFLLSEKAAPGVSSAVLSAASLLGGIWMDVEAIGGSWLKICEALPFYHAVKIGRILIGGTDEPFGGHLLVVVGYAVVVFGLACAAFARKRKG